MTADIRTAAQREADRRYPHTGRVDQTALVEGALRVGFKKGVVWAAERVTPTREQIAEALCKWHDEESFDGKVCLSCTQQADVMLALIAGLAEGEQQ